MIGRGLFRLWIVVSVAWLCVAAFVMWPRGPIAWSWSGPPMIHVPVSETGETLDYPPEWGVDRIRDDLKKKTLERWAKGDEHKATCAALLNPGPNYDPLDYSVPLGPHTPTRWEVCNSLPGEQLGRANLSSQPVPIYQVVTTVAPWAFGPSLLLLIVGLALGWVVRGFRPHLSGPDTANDGR